MLPEIQGERAEIAKEESMMKSTNNVQTSSF